MAYTFAVNNIISANTNFQGTTSSYAMYILISTLIAAGWTKVADSDGTTYSAVGTQVTGGGSGANGLGNANAWVRVQAPPVNNGAIVNQKREFIFQRSSSDDNSWRMKYSAYGGFTGGAPSATVVPSNETVYFYPETNQDATTSLNNVVFGTGQSFVGNGSTLSTSQFYLKKTGSPTGTAVAKIYAHSGTFGTSSIPTGALLAQSNGIDVSTLTTSYALTELKFTGSNQITLTNAVDYVITIEYLTGTVSNTLDIGRDGSSPTAQGNSATWDGVTWTPVSTSDLCLILRTGIQDEITIIGGGSDAVPVYTLWFSGGATLHWHVIAGGAAEFYSFIAWGTGITNGNFATTQCNIFLDVMQTGSFPSADVDPAVVTGSVQSGFGSDFTILSNFPAANVTNPCKSRAWLGPVSFAGSSITGTNSVNVGIISIYNFGTSNMYETNPWTGEADILPCLWGNNNTTAAPRGIKGFSTLFYASTLWRTQMETCDTISPGSKDKVFVDRYWLPWSGVLPIA